MLPRIAGAIVFTLTPRHLKALETAPDAEFSYRLIEHVRQVFPEQIASASDDELLTRVRAARERARTLGFTTEKNIALFVDLGFGLGEDFETNLDHARIAGIIGDVASHEDVRICRVYLELPATG
jgi:hypothetical protein